MTSVIGLRWEQKDERAYYGHSGRVTMALVVLRHDGVWVWELTKVHTRHICKHGGESRDAKAAMRAADRSWRKWLNETGLKPSEA